MCISGKIKKGAYYDSVALMNVGKALAGLPGVVDAAVVMGTRENAGILERSGLWQELFEGTTDSDLLISVKAENEETATAMLAEADELLTASLKKGDSGDTAVTPWSLEGAVNLLPDANMVLISVAGRYAAHEALKALELGRHVMLFSDNVSIEDELRLKQVAHEKGLLVMGPDCGTAIINGVPLAFANVVRRGGIGVVAASGTGLQEVTCLISNEGAGISQAIGTGGRDVKKAIGGIMFLDALRALAEDDETKVILLVSKPPHESVVAEIQKLAASLSKPVISFFLGADTGVESLEAAALLAVASERGEPTETVAERLRARDAELETLAKTEAAKCRPGQRYVRGLFSGGTFCSEAQILWKESISPLYSNAPAGSAVKMKDVLQSEANTVIDLGEDEFTVGRPHPMIDFSLRNQRIREEANDPETAVILLDVVLGYGSNMNPMEELDAVLREAVGKTRVICSVTGTDQDPQNRSRVSAALKALGAVVLPSNAAACKLAGNIIRELGA
ncbi:MAG: acyl-CoA synthetase FdrA [Kiritimatiellae bacterium]|nr:acyl-CoA synthetase FdrA [Kiritimatiellia bacterium]MDD4735765.1 acyl-CoA synthetase FdrA [Kiritimatiellia bacterium]